MNSLWSWWEVNWLVAAARSGSAEDADFPLDNAVDPTLERPWRVPARAATLTADCSVLRPFRLFALFGMRNATPAMQVRISLSNLTPGGTDVWSSGWLTTGIVRGDDQWLLGQAVTRRARFVRLELDDPGNTDDYLLVGLAWAGDAVETAHNPNPGIAFGHDDPTEGDSTPGGQSYLNPLREVRYARGAYNSLPRDQAMGPITDLLRSGSAACCVFLPSGELAQQQAICGLLRKSHLLARRDGDDVDLHRFEFEIRERL